MDITFDSSKNHNTVVLDTKVYLITSSSISSGSVVCSLLSLHEWSQVVDSLLHDSSRLDDLWQEHLSASEVVSDDGHACHEWSLDDVERSWVHLSGFFGILINVLINTFDESVLESLLNIVASPWVLLLDNGTTSGSFEGFESLFLL